MRRDLGNGAARFGRPNKVECIVFNDENLTCNWSSEEKPTANYSMYYWYEDEKPTIEECTHYLQRDGVNIECRVNVIDLYTCFHVYLNASHNRTRSTAPMLLMHRVQPGPPFNFTVQSLANNQLLLGWKSPYKSYWCLEHEVKYRSNKDKDWTKQKTTGMNFSVASVDPDKFYTFYVRSKIRETCGNTDLWSDPAGPIHWGKETAASMELWVQFLICVGSVCLLTLLVVTLLHMERVRLVLMPVIPNPSKKFEELFTAYHGNFSEWVGVSKDAMESFKPNYRESICRVSELFPSGGYLPVMTDAMVKAEGMPGLLVDPIPKTNIP
ncbi:cytokine receptor common subunit gamma isoform X2 [Sceloporus undulatus]|uniref:cytokine receptor common subunit gamma isoform X2 n=1 Tax=Sceloporus undulatus TaxID=8520 RepID=UPI001C4CE453|nr:cytokine receptor common subunit gamma isoform X2 [Sceloporus undulatus]